MSAAAEPLWRSHPGAAEIRAAAPGSVAEVGDRIWVSPGLSNSYLIGTADGAVALNAGMGFEGPVHRENYAGLHAGRLRFLVLTQGHYDHVGGVDALREDGTRVVAQARWRQWRDDNERLASFRARNAAFAWTEAIAAAVEHAASAAGGFPAQSSPVPEVVVDEELELELGGRRIRLLAAPGGETTDSLLVHLPEERICFCGNVFGALFGHIPNLVTMRGDRYRDPLAFIETAQQVRDLGVEVLYTGHFEPVRGADLIDAELARLQGAVGYLHDETVRGMEAGESVHTLMREIALPPELEVGEGYGKVAWNVRAIWESYAGWFHHRSTTELYPGGPDEVYAELGGLAGPDRLAEAAAARLAAGEINQALHLAEVALAAAPGHAGASTVSRESHRRLLAASENFWEAAWLRRELRRMT